MAELADALIDDLDHLEVKPIPSETPIFALYRRYQEITDTAEAHPSTDDAELERLFYKERDAIEDAINALPCTGPADFAAKAVVATARGSLCLEWTKDPLWKEARNLIEVAP